MLDTESDVHLGRRPLAIAPTVEPSLPDAPAADGPSTPPPSPAGAPAPRVGAPNRGNGRTPKTIQGDLGELMLSTPRDRNGTFEPQAIAKHQRRVPGFDEKIPYVRQARRST
jgi:putative transposase